MTIRILALSLYFIAGTLEAACPLYDQYVYIVNYLKQNLDDFKKTLDNFDQTLSNKELDEVTRLKVLRDQRYTKNLVETTQQQLRSAEEKLEKCSNS